MLSACTLELPIPEFDYLAELAIRNNGHIVLSLEGEQAEAPLVTHDWCIQSLEMYPVYYTVLM